MTILPTIEFEKLLTLIDIIPLSSLMDLLLGDLDAISKNCIKKQGYQHYCGKTKLWNEMAKPLLILIAIKQKKLRIIDECFECPRCKTLYKNWRQLSPHHKKYTNLYNYRVKENHPRSIEIMCISCHQKEEGIL